MPQLFDSLRRPRLDGMNPPPIKAYEQGFEPGMGERHQAILDAWPCEAVLFQPLVGQHDAGAIPVDQLQSVCLARPEHKDCSGVHVGFSRPEMRMILQSGHPSPTHLPGSNLSIVPDMSISLYGRCGSSHSTRCCQKPR